MPIAMRTFRVFVSSTFDDLKEERDALQREVFPRVRDLCQSYGCRFQAIDLRWGIRDGAWRKFGRGETSWQRIHFLELLEDLRPKGVSTETTTQ